jgi:hypothetical protein
MMESLSSLSFISLPTRNSSALHRVLFSCYQIGGRANLAEVSSLSSMLMDGYNSTSFHCVIPPSSKKFRAASMLGASSIRTAKWVGERTWLERKATWCLLPISNILGSICPTSSLTRPLAEGQDSTPCLNNATYSMIMASGLKVALWYIPKPYTYKGEFIIDRVPPPS